MTNYEYGGKTNKDMSSKMAVVDMIPMLLEKFNKEADMIRQYQKYADLLKLNSFNELIGISHTMARLHLLLHRVSHPNGKKCQVHVASSAAAKHMFGLAAGPAKYFAKIAHSSFTITFGPHPQVEYSPFSSACGCVFCLLTISSLSLPSTMYRCI